MYTVDPLAVARTTFEITQNVSDTTMSVLHDVLNAANPNESARDAVRDAVVGLAVGIEALADWEEDDWIETCDVAARFLIGTIRSQSRHWRDDNWDAVAREVMAEVRTGAGA